MIFHLQKKMKKALQELVVNKENMSWDPRVGPCKESFPKPNLLKVLFHSDVPQHLDHPSQCY